MSFLLKIALFFTSWYLLTRHSFTTGLVGGHLGCWKKIPFNCGKTATRETSASNRLRFYHQSRRKFKGGYMCDFHGLLVVGVGEEGRTRGEKRRKDWGEPLQSPLTNSCSPSPSTLPMQAMCWRYSKFWKKCTCVSKKSHVTSRGFRVKLLSTPFLLVLCQGLILSKRTFPVHSCSTRFSWLNQCFIFSSLGKESSFALLERW